MKNCRAILKKLLENKEFLKILNDTADALGAGALILDVNGNILANIGHGETYSESEADSFPLNIKGEQAGYVKGSKKAQAIVSIIAYMLAAEYDKRDLIDEVSNRYKEINLFYDFTEKILDCNNLNDIVLMTLSLIKNFIKTDTVSIMLRNEETSWIDVITAYDYGEKTVKKSIAAYNGESIAEYVMMSGNAEIINDLSLDGWTAPDGGKSGSMMCSPLKVRDKVIGAICIATEKIAEFTSSDLKLFATLSHNVAVFVENVSLYKDLKEVFLSTVYTLAETIEMRDNYTGNHTKRVMEYSYAIGDALGMKNDELEILRLSAILHDIGKIGIRDSVLLKPSKLTDEEFALMKKHPVLGEEILKKIKGLEYVVPGVKHHHERHDGKGYPDGLKGDEIELNAKIISVADTFDAMTSDRPYRKGMDSKAALDELVRCSGTQFDEKIVNAFIKAYPHIDI
ncbi:MAG: HD domain-containing protein [Deltaproteobacteria bacterium]|nr:HD domain-containing protein [Deltaproteobacteria bacterium]